MGTARELLKRKKLVKIPLRVENVDHNSESRGVKEKNNRGGGARQRCTGKGPKWPQRNLTKPENDQDKNR